MSTTFSKLLGNRIRYFRKLQGLTQADLAEKIGVETSTLAHIEIGKNLPAISRLPLIADSLNIEVFQLFIKGDISQNKNIIENINILLKTLNEKQLKLIYDLIGNAIDLQTK